MGSKCSTGCPYGDCPTYGYCMRRKSVKPTWVAPAMDKTKERSHENDLAAYRAARRQGMEPATTQRADVEKAIKISNETGKAFKAF